MFSDLFHGQYRVTGICPTFSMQPFNMFLSKKLIIHKPVFLEGRIWYCKWALYSHLRGGSIICVFPTLHTFPTALEDVKKTLLKWASCHKGCSSFKAFFSVWRGNSISMSNIHDGVCLMHSCFLMTISEVELIFDLVHAPEAMQLPRLPKSVSLQVIFPLSSSLKLGI